MWAAIKRARRALLMKGRKDKVDAAINLLRELEARLNECEAHTRKQIKVIREILETSD